MEIKIIITWYCDEYDIIPQKYQSELEYEALDVIMKARQDFYVGGELQKCMDGIAFNGYWSLTESKAL